MAFSMFALSSVRPTGKYRPGRRNAEPCRTSHTEPPTRGESETHNQPDPILHGFLAIWPAFQKSIGRSARSTGGGDRRVGEDPACCACLRADASLSGVL